MFTLQTAVLCITDIFAILPSLNFIGVVLYFCLEIVLEKNIVNLEPIFSIKWWLRRFNF